MPVFVEETTPAPTASRRPANVLAAVQIGGPSSTPSGARWLEANVPNRSLVAGASREIWLASGPVVPHQVAGGRAAADDRSLFVEVQSADAGADLEAQTFELYLRLFQGIERADYPHLLRVWNYVPRVHETQDGLDRYMLFCKGRSKAFEAVYGAAFAERLSAASAVGCPGHALVVHALTSREPGDHVENPRQTAAYRYPERYGPRSPSFARGTVAPPAWAGAVLVSGTASIVGHESTNPGDPVEQTRETMRNIEAVLDAAGAPGRGEVLCRRLRSLRVYVRRAEQLPEIRQTVAAAAGGSVPATWVHAEICRPELLVEIEAISRAS